jgi:hypothetical protein
MLIAIVFWPVLFQGRLLLPTDQFDTMVLPWSQDYGPPQAYNHTLTDAMMQSYPWKVAAQTALRHGDLYYWNPYILNGYPQYAASRQFFDIFNLLLIPVDLPFAFGLIITLQLFVAGCGMYLLLRTLRFQRVVCLLFAIAWTFNGMFLTHALNLWATATFCWIPYCLAACFRYHERGSLFYLFAAALFTGLSFLAATLQSAVFVMIAIAIVNLGWSFAQNEKQWRRAITSITVPLLLGFFLAAIMWLPSLELFLEVIRNGKLYSPTHTTEYTILNRVLSLALLPTFYAPELLGIVRSLSLTSIAHVHPLDFSGYVGFFEMMVATWALFTLKDSGKAVRPFAWLVFGAFLLPICTPLFAWLYHRFFIIGTLGLTVVGAERFNTLLSGTELHRRFNLIVRRFGIASTSFFGLIGIVTALFSISPEIRARVSQIFLHHTVGTAFADGNDAWVRSRVEGTFEHYSILSPSMLIPFGVALAICIYLFRWSRSAKPNSKLLCISLIGISAVHIIFWWRSFLPMLSPERFPLLPKNHTIERITQQDGNDRVFIDRRSHPQHQYLFLDNLPSLYGISSISGYESEVIRSVYPMLDSISPTALHLHALGLWGVRSYVFQNGIIPIDTLPIADSGKIMIYSNPFVRPRATVYYCSETLSSDSDVLHRLFDESAPNDKVLFTASSSVRPVSDTIPWDSAHIVNETDHRVDIMASAQQNGYLVLADNYYPGWKCFVDGKEQPIIRTNYSMRAVFLSPGKHNVIFSFDPLSAKYGRWISLLSFGLTVTGLLTSRRRKQTIPLIVDH